MTSRLIYLDNAATSFPKPKAVTDEVALCVEQYCGNPGRGSHPLAMASADGIFECRSTLASFLGADDPANVIFSLNTTYAINLLLKGILKQGDHVIISDLEHNSVFRPIYKMATAGMIEYDVFPSMCVLPSATPSRICAGIAKRLRPNTKMVICTHQSNICSYSLPLAHIGAFCHRHGLLFAVDGAQSAGHLPLNMKDMCIDALAVPSHKGLLGIQGAGALILSKSLPLDTLIEGGNGLYSLEGDMSDMPPERYESGTLPTPAIVGLLRGIQAVSKMGVEQIGQHDQALFYQARERLEQIQGISLYASQYAGSTLLFHVEDVPSEKLAHALGQKGICVRGGHHCSALGHKTLGTPPDGAVRISFGIYNTTRDLDLLANALHEIL